MNISANFVSNSPFVARPFAPNAPAMMSPMMGGMDGFMGAFPSYGGGPDMGGIFQSFLGGHCPCSGGEMQMQMLSSMMQMMMQLMMMFSGMGMAGNQYPQSMSGHPGFGQGGGPAALAAGSPGGGGGINGPAQHGGAPAQRVNPPTSGSPAASTSGASPVKIGAGTKALVIGDSHSVGTFGKELDKLMRGTGAQVSTYASAGATGSTFVNGNSTKYGYWEKRADGTESTTNYGQSRATPKLESLIGREKPHVIIVNLGANFRSGDPKSQVDQIGQIAKKYNIPLVWVGPPKTAKDNSNPASLQQFDQKMAAAVAPYGKYVPSTPHVSRYSGGDGLHFGGSQGTQIAKQWASGVFRSITG